jgi:hypothetical protein
MVAAKDQHRASGQPSGFGLERADDRVTADTASGGRSGQHCCRPRQPGGPGDNEQAAGLERWLTEVEPGFADRILPITLPVAVVWASQLYAQPFRVVERLIAATVKVKPGSRLSHGTPGTPSEQGFRFLIPSGPSTIALIDGQVENAAGAELVLTWATQPGHLPAETARTSTSFTIFEGTSEIQRMIIGRAVTGLDVR